MQALFAHLIGVPVPGCPFGDDAQGASEALILKTAPEFSTVAAASIPLGVQHRQMRCQGALPHTEHVLPGAPHHLPHQFAAAPGPAHDLLDRVARFLEGHDVLRIARIDFHTTSRSAALAFAIKCHRSATCIASGNALAAAPVARHDADARMLPQPCFGGGHLAVGRQGDNAPAFQVADDGAVAMVAAIRPLAISPLSMPTTARGSVRGRARWRTTRSSVSLDADHPLTGLMFHRHARLADACHRPCGRHPGPLGDSGAALLRQGPDGGVLLTATLFGAYPFLLKLHIDGG